MRARDGRRKAPFRAARPAPSASDKEVPAMVYAQPSDMIARYPNRDLVQLTNEDPTQTVVDQTVLQQALADASAEIDGYLESRFSLPLTDPPAVLARLTCDIAMYRLQALRPLHDLDEARRRIWSNWRSVGAGCD